MTEPATLEEPECQLTTGQVAVPRPAPTVPSPAVRIPDGDAADAALQILASLSPSAAAEIRGRIAGIGEQLGDSVESARLDPSMGIVPFLRASSRLIRLRTTLEERLRRLQGSPEPSSGPTVEEEVLKLSKLVRRWRDGREIMQAGSPIIGVVRSALDAIDDDVNALVASYCQGHAFTSRTDGAAYQSGLNTRDDEFLLRLQDRLGVRASLTGRLCRLDPFGEGYRQAHVTQVLEAAGGSDTVRDAIQPAMAADTSQLLAVRGEIRGLISQIDGLDPETRRAGVLTTRRAELEARAESLAGQVDAQRTAAADAILHRAGQGIRQGITALASCARAVTTGVAERLDEIGATDAELTAIVGELIAPALKEKP